MGCDLSLDDLMDLAEKQLDAIEANGAFADTTTWLAFMSFVERVQNIVTPPPLSNDGTASIRSKAEKHGSNHPGR